MSSHDDSADEKWRVARTVKWNVVERLSTQVLYAVSGIILANVLSEADFGLVGAVLVFQAFASIFMDSGFSMSLLQRKNPTQLDYSTVLWFNIGMALLLYAILYLCAPLIAWCYQNDQRLIPLSRVMFLTFILNATAIVQINRLMKRMDVKMLAVSNTIALAIAAVVGIWMAIAGYGAWAIVWQSIVLAGVKSAILWLTGGWVPMFRFSWRSLKSFVKMGMGVMTTSTLNTIFQNIYSFFIGNKVGMVSLGYYYQAEKWSKMGIASLSQVLTSSFLPVLSKYQDDPERFAQATAKMNRSTAYLLFPCIGMLVMMSTPLFHALFHTKWDASIALFQLLLVRGIFTVLTSLYSNYILALGKARLLVVSEVLRDVVAIVAIVITLPYIAMSTPDDPTLGVRILIWGQLVASGATWIGTLLIITRLSGRSAWQYIMDNVPYMIITAIAMVPMAVIGMCSLNPWFMLMSQVSAGAAVYLLANRLAGSKVQADVLAYVSGRLSR